jgi:thioredoxin-like negative regulator of GroEL
LASFLLDDRPRLIFFHSPTSGPSRGAEGYLAHVLQNRRNHGTFVVHRVSEEERPDLIERFGIAALPAVVVVVNKAVSARLERVDSAKAIASFLSPWLH